MSKIKHIIYALLWVGYLFFTFFFFPSQNINVTIPSLILFTIGAWLYGTEYSLLMIFLIIIPYHLFLFDYYGDILATYQAKAIGVFSASFIALLAGRLKEMRDRVKGLSVELDRKVEERTNELDQLILKLITDDEHIRHNLAQDIHDGLGQNLTGLLLYSSSLLQDLKQQNSFEQQKAEELTNVAERTLNLARKVSRTLFPHKLEATGLETAFDELTSYFLEIKPIRFIINMDGAHKHLPENINVHFYRIAYECILNTVHNDNPTQIQISLTSRNHSHCLSLKISGCSNPHVISDNMFLELMRYRARLVSGKLDYKITNQGNILISCTIDSIDTDDQGNAA
jgi:signal transduction histidine kinase